MLKIEVHQSGVDGLQLFQTQKEIGLRGILLMGEKLDKRDRGGSAHIRGTREGSFRTPGKKAYSTNVRRPRFKGKGTSITFRRLQGRLDANDGRLRSRRQGGSYRIKQKGTTNKVGEDEEKGSPNDKKSL